MAPWILRPWAPLSSTSDRRISVARSERGFTNEAIGGQSNLRRYIAVDGGDFLIVKVW
jgi:hypothetical protein